MTIYATFNPIGSTNPKDLIDNAQNLDYLILGPLLSYPDRRGVNRLSWAGIEASFAAAQAQRTADFNAAQAQRAVDYAASEANRGYENPVPYAAGISLTRVTQLIQYNSELYKAKAGTLPWTTTGVWATDSAKLVSVGDASLRQELADPDNDLVGWERRPITADFYLNRKASQQLSLTGVSPWEFRNLVTDKPAPTDPGTWDWSPAVNHSMSEYGESELSNGVFGVAQQIIVPPGAIITGKGPGYAGGTAYSSIRSSTIRPWAGFVGTSVISGKAVTPDNVLTAVQFAQFKLDLSLCDNHGLVLEDTYDGAIISNVHIVGTSKTKRGLWFKKGAYGLGQTVLMENSQVMARTNSDGVVAPFFAEALNESNIIGCKFFGSVGGATASLGAAAEFAGCSGMNLYGSSVAFADVGVLISDDPVRKTIGFLQDGCTYEALRTTAVKARPGASRRASQLRVIAPRYYDSVFTFTNAVDVDNTDGGYFDCDFKSGIFGAGSTQATIDTQRQQNITDSGTFNWIRSRPNAIEQYSATNKRARFLAGLTADASILATGGIGQNIRTFTASPGTVLATDRILIVNRTATGNYTLSAANSFGTGKAQLLTVRNIGSASANFSPAGADTLNGTGMAFTVLPGTVASFSSDGAGGWFAQ